MLIMDNKKVYIDKKFINKVCTEFLCVFNGVKIKTLCFHNMELLSKYINFFCRFCFRIKSRAVYIIEITKKIFTRDSIFNKYFCLKNYASKTLSIPLKKGRFRPLYPLAVFKNSWEYLRDFYWPSEIK
jgi:hypothetical protein